MSGGSSETASRILSRHFPTFLQAAEIKYWRRIVKWRGDAPTFHLLKTMETEWRQVNARAEDVSGRRLMMLRHRGDFRAIISRDHPLVIKLYLTNCPEEMIPLCIWLWSRCVNQCQLFGLPQYRFHPSAAVRKHVAKALRRLEAWTYLREMAATYPEDATLVRYATATIRRPFQERLKTFAASIDDSHAGEVATPSRMPFWAQQDSWHYSPPKSIELIRRMLRRIRHWVRWGVS